MDFLFGDELENREVVVEIDDNNNNNNNNNHNNNNHNNNNYDDDNNNNNYSDDNTQQFELEEYFIKNGEIHASLECGFYFFLFRFVFCFLFFVFCFFFISFSYFPTPKTDDIPELKGHITQSEHTEFLAKIDKRNNKLFVEFHSNLFFYTILWSCIFGVCVFVLFNLTYVIVFMGLISILVYGIFAFLFGRRLPWFPWRYMCMDEERKREVVRGDVERWSEERFGSRFDFYFFL